MLVKRTSRLNLPEVTLVGIDTYCPEKTLLSMWFTMRQVTFGHAVIVSSRGISPPGGSMRGVTPLIMDLGPDRAVREQFLVMRLHETFTTPFCLHMEWDSGVANPRAWDPDWLQYDYIGAPWFWPYSEPICAIPCRSDNCVGNSGFALISQKFAKLAGQIANPSREELKSSDGYLCRTLRPALEAKGVKFAPEAVAEEFSCENRIYSGQFGWHGKGTMQINNWNVPFAV